MTSRKTISGKFDNEEMTRISEYIESEGVTVNELVITAVKEIVTKNIDIIGVDTYKQNKEKRYTEVVSGRLPENDMSRVDTYLHTYKAKYNDLVRCAVLHFIDSAIPLNTKVDSYLSSKKVPSVDEIVNVLAAIADKNPTQRSKSAKRMGAWARVIWR